MPIDPQTYDFEDDELPPKAVLAQLEAHDQRMRAARRDLAEIKAVLENKWWAFHHGYDKAWDQVVPPTDVEKNEIWPLIRTLKAALYPRASRVTLAADATGAGDTAKSMLVDNSLLVNPNVYDTQRDGMEGGLLYGLAGAKVGFTPGRGTPLSRVYFRAFPTWECVVDYDSGNRDDNRYVGHVYYAPLRKVAREYGLKRDELVGTKRLDFLTTTGDGGKSTDNRSRKNKAADTDDTAFVRVLEFCNLVDTIPDEHLPDVRYQGRLEIYVLGQGELSKKPVWMGKLPLDDANGIPLAHIEPLIYVHETHYPNRGLSQASRLMPQQREANIFRSYIAGATRKDTRQYILRMVKGLDADSLTAVLAGVEGACLKINGEEYTGPLAEILYKIDTGQLNPNILTWLSMIQADIDRIIGASPNARGIITKGTAFEAQAANLYTDSDLGELATAQARWMGRIVKLMHRAVISAMQTVEDSSGAYDAPEVGLSMVGGAPGEDAPIGSVGAQEAAAVAADASGGPEPFVATPPKNTLKVTQQVLRLVERGKPVDVTVDDLDGEFEISFVEGGRTPAGDAEMRQAVMALLEPYMTLGAKAGLDPVVLAEAFMRVIADRFDLPKDLHLEELQAAALAAAEKAAEKKPSGTVKGLAEAGGADAPAGPAEATPSPEELQAVVARALTLPPDEAIPVLRSLFSSEPTILADLDSIAGLPPEEQAEALANLFGAAPPSPPTESQPSLEISA